MQKISNFLVGFNTMRRIPAVTLFLAVAIVGRAAPPADSTDGFLCCNAYSDGKYISDVGVPGSERHRVPVGSPVHVSSVGKHKLKVDIENKKQEIGNDYSRGISMSEFEKRLIVTGDPSERIKTFPKNIQLAIADGRLIRGMTREQTLMSLGYPTTDDVPNLSSKSWLYWISDHVQYRVDFDANDLVADVENVLDARSQILIQ